MKRMSPEKKQKLALAIIVTAAVVACIYLFLIAPQRESNAALESKIKDSNAKLTNYRAEINKSGSMTNELKVLGQELGAAEEDVASGDIYSWTFQLILKIKAGSNVDIPMISQPVISDTELLAGFPYKQARFSLSGTAYYHDFGKFVADFENKHPHMRLVGLMLESGVGNLTFSTPEKLTFRMDLVVLIKPNS